MSRPRASAHPRNRQALGSVRSPVRSTQGLAAVSTEARARRIAPPGPEYPKVSPLVPHRPSGCLPRSFTPAYPACVVLVSCALRQRWSTPRLATCRIHIASMFASEPSLSQESREWCALRDSRLAAPRAPPPAVDNSSRRSPNSLPSRDALAQYPRATLLLPLRSAVSPSARFHGLTVAMPHLRPRHVARCACCAATARPVDIRTSSAHPLESRENGILTDRSLPL